MKTITWVANFEFKANDPEQNLIEIAGWQF